MTPDEVQAAVDAIRKARDLCAEIKASIEKVRAESGLDALEEQLSLTKAVDAAARESLNEWWNGTDDANRPSKPKGLSFTCRDTTIVVDVDALPREALKPDPRALREGMPGTFTCAVFHARVTG